MKKINQISKAVQKYEYFLKNEKDAIKQEVSAIIANAEWLIVEVNVMKEKEEKEFKRTLENINKISFKKEFFIKWIVHKLQFIKMSLKLEKINKKIIQIDDLKCRLMNILNHLKELNN